MKVVDRLRAYWPALLQRLCLGLLDEMACFIHFTKLAMLLRITLSASLSFIHIKFDRWHVCTNEIRSLPAVLRFNECKCRIESIPKAIYQPKTLIYIFVHFSVLPFNHAENGRHVKRKKASLFRKIALTELVRRNVSYHSK